MVKPFAQVSTSQIEPRSAASYISVLLIILVSVGVKKAMSFSDSQRIRSSIKNKQKI